MTRFVGILRLSSVANTISFSYAPAAGSGTLTVSSGGQVVASIDMIGSYTSANFSITAGVGGTVAIVDPSVVNGRQCRDRAGKALPAARPRPAGHPLRRSNDAPHSELRNAGQLRATDGRHADHCVPWQLHGRELCYDSGRDGSALVSGTPLIEQQPLLNHSAHG